MVIHISTNWVRHRLTSLMFQKTLPQSQTVTITQPMTILK